MTKTMKLITQLQDAGIAVTLESIDNLINKELNDRREYCLQLLKEAENLMLKNYTDVRDIEVIKNSFRVAHTNIRDLMCD